MHFIIHTYKGDYVQTNAAVKETYWQYTFWHVSVTEMWNHFTEIITNLVQKYTVYWYHALNLQCFDTVGWVAGRASGL